MRKCLVVSEEYAGHYQIHDAIVLMPSVSLLPPWRIEFKEAQEFTGQNTLLTKKLTDYFVKERIFTNTKYSDKAVHQILRPVTAFINYVLTDRALRAIRFLQVNIDEVVLPVVPDFPATSTWNQLYAFSRDSWKCNQFIVNSLLDCCLDVVEYERVRGGESENYGYYHPNHGFDSTIRNARNPLSKQLLNALLSPKKTLGYINENIDKWFPA